MMPGRDQILADAEKTNGQDSLLIHLGVHGEQPRAHRSVLRAVSSVAFLVFLGPVQAVLRS